ncbi:MAG: OmpA family protein [Alphaproteobacteria bacterium]|nr:OmpA family protein [Alphaproteobacteria bacterium]MBV8407238.1 OmpA family protein [Alphaproteobacteria bacterium]
MRTKSLIVAAAVLTMPAAAQAQLFDNTSWAPYPGVYIGAEGGLNWLLNNNSYIMNTGWAVGGKVGYDFVGPRLEIEGLYHSNNGTGVRAFPNGYATINGQIQQVSLMANALYDFFPAAVVTPYVGGGIGVAWLDDSIQGCNLCATQFAYQGIIGVGWNAMPSLRVGLEGRYYGTTNPGNYVNNNILALLSVSYKFGAPEAAPPPPPPPAVAPPSFMVFFDWDKSNLSQQALATIQQAADAFRQKGNARITATGHTDTSGPESYNMALSLRRANAVKDALVRDGVPAQAITVIGMGEKGLLVPTGDGVREPQNRRVEIVIQ